MAEYSCDNNLSSNTTYSSTVTALLTIEGIGLGFGVVFILLTLIQYVFLDKLLPTYIFIQSQVRSRSVYIGSPIKFPVWGPINIFFNNR
jgi:hypothetical protein